MRKHLSKLTQAGFILAAIAAGSLNVPAAAAQTTTPKKTTNSSASAHSSTTHAAFSPAKSSTKSASAKSGKSSGKKSSRTKKVKGQAAPTPERINEIQDALAKRGAFGGTPTGKWDDSTVDAMKSFQIANHLNPTGKIDAPTLQKLGLGSEIAGVAAPPPPPTGTVNRLLSRSSQRDPDPSDNN